MDFGRTFVEQALMMSPALLKSCVQVRMKDYSQTRDAQSGPGPAGTRTKIFFLPGPGPNFFSRRDRDQIFFLTETGTGTGTKNDWSRSCLSKTYL